ncbi:MAG: class II aldolase/adducin family protein [Bacteroidota bacterium]
MYHSPTVAQLIDICHRLYSRGMVTATDGNVSVRLANGNILATRSGINKGMVTENDFVEVTLSGEQIGGSGKPSTELGMHLFIYRQRSDVNAVVHAHPIYATGFATARLPLDRCTFPEVIVGLGAIPLAEYATPSTREVAESLGPFVKNSDAILLANHGAVTYGPELYDAYFKMEKVEHAAHITFVATMLGGPRGLTTEDVEKLRKVSVQSYGKDFSSKIACEVAENEQFDLSEDELRKYITEKLHTLKLQ